MSDLQVIYLAPECFDAGEGRTWAVDCPWDACECPGSPHKPVRYEISRGPKMPEDLTDLITSIKAGAINRPEIIGAIEALSCENSRLRVQITQAAEWFEQYEQGHVAKGATDKASRNGDRARACRAALSPAKQDETGG